MAQQWHFLDITSLEMRAGCKGNYFNLNANFGINFRRKRAQRLIAEASWQVVSRTVTFRKS